MIKDDSSLFEYFFMIKLQIYLFEHPWDKARYIVAWNELKDMIIHHMVEYNSNKKCCSCCTIVVKDTYKTNRLHGDIQFNIKQYVSNSHTNSLYCPLLKLFKGMKVILIENL
jgi:predicted transcriptional regulator